jgi:competence protein ComEA
MGGGFREWLAGLGRREFVVALTLVVALLGGAGMWYVRGLSPPVPVAADRVNEASAPSPSPSPALLIVHVAGWVRSPGVYKLNEGDRVIDALELAGGARRGADLSALNLAAVLTDAQQVLVPKRGEAVAAAGSGAVTSPIVNLNTATLDELDTLPGIGEVLAQRILDHRQEHGPFAAVEDLLEVSGIGEKRLEDVRDKVTV